MGNIPDIARAIDKNGRNVVIVDGQHELHDLPELLAAAPALTGAAAAPELAQAVAHLAAGTDYRVILAPSDYESAYRAQLDREDASAPWREGVLRLRDHGVPDFAGIHAPAIQAGRLVFFAESSHTGLPYRVDLDLGTATMSPDIFRAVALRPLPPSAMQPPVNPEYVGATGLPLPPEPGDRLAEPPPVIDGTGSDEADKAP